MAILQSIADKLADEYNRTTERLRSVRRIDPTPTPRRTFDWSPAPAPAPELPSSLRSLRDAGIEPTAADLTPEAAQAYADFDAGQARRFERGNREPEPFRPIDTRRGPTIPMQPPRTRITASGAERPITERFGPLPQPQFAPGPFEEMFGPTDPETARLASIDRGSPGGEPTFPGYERGVRAAGSVGAAALRPIGQEDIGRAVGEFAFRGIVPSTPAEFAAALATGGMLGETTVAGRAIRAQAKKAGRSVRVYAVSPEGKAAIKRLASESGMAKIPGDLPEPPPRLPDEAVPPIEAAPVEPAMRPAEGARTPTTAGPSELVPAARPAPPEPATAAPDSPPSGGGVPPAPPPTDLAPSGGDVLPPDNFEGDVLALTETLRKSKKLRPEQERAFAAERKQRAGRVGGILEGGTGEAAFIKARGSLKGEFEGHATFEPPDIPEPRRARMIEEIRATDKLQPFQKLNAKQAFDKVIAGVLPEPKELEFLERVFGTDFSQAVLEKAPATWAQRIVDVLTLPKAMLASFDLSFPLRQGMILAPSQPKAWLRSWGPMVKAFATESNAKIADDAMQADPLWSRFLDAEGYHSPLKGGARAQREETFASRLIEKIPGMRSSQRAFQTFGNKLRFEAWKNLVNGTKAVGEPDAVDAAFAKFVNHATGRGDVPFRAGEILPGLSAFFSLRNFVSRFQVIADPLLVKSVPLQVRAKMAGDLAKFFASGVTFLGMLKLAHDNGVPGFENVTVAHDPRSTDYGKIKVGDRRYDLWTGYAQMARYSAQVMSGERLALLPDDSKALVDINRKKYALRFLESKLDPSLGLLIDLYESETYTGEPLKGDLPTLKREAYNRLVPLFLQDLNESLQKYGPEGAAFAVPGLVGASVTDYETSEGAKQYAAKQVMPGRWEKLGLPTTDTGFRSEYWKSRLPAATVDPRKFDSFTDYRTAYIEHWTAKRPENISEAMARDLSARKFDSLDAVKNFHARQQAAELRFWKAHPDLLQQALDANIEDVSKEKLKILESAGVP